MRVLVTKDQYFDAAIAALAGSGFEGLNIGVLCRTLGVTSGSFYHHFGSWDGFVPELLEHWELTAMRVLDEMRFGHGEPHDDLGALRSLTLSLNHAAEAALRGWGGNDHGVRDAVARVDARRVKTVRRAIGRTIPDPHRADVVADLGMDMLVGFQLRDGNDRDRAGFASVLDEYLTLVYSYRTSEEKK